MNVRSFNVRQGLQWLGCGWRFWKKDLVLWWLVSLLYVVFAIVLTRVPVIGLLLVYFITPVFAASSMLTMQKMRAGNIAPEAKPQSLGAKLASSYFSIFSELDKILVVLVLGVICLALGMVIQMVGQAVGGSALLSPDGLLDMGAEAALRVIGTHVIMDILLTFVIVTLALALPLYVSGKEVSDSLTAAMSGLKTNLLPLLLFSAVLLIPIFSIALTMQASFLIGAPLVLLISSACIALYLNSVYCIFKLMFH